MPRFFDTLVLMLPGIPADMSLPARILSIARELQTTVLNIQIQSGLARGPQIIVVNKDGMVWVCINEQITQTDIEWAIGHIERKEPHFVITLVATTGIITPEAREKYRRWHGFKCESSKDPKQIAKNVRRSFELFALDKRREEEAEEYPM